MRMRIIERASDAKTTILFISDLHWPPRGDISYKLLSTVINALGIDWLIFGGDLCTYLSRLPEALKWLAALNAKFGRLAVLGNRESVIQWQPHSFWRRQFQTAGFTLLCNDILETPSIRFYGLDDARYGRPSWKDLTADKTFTITISHNPDAIADTSPDRYIGDFVLCGHTHAGQIVLPIVGAPYTSSAYGRQFQKDWQIRRDGVPCFVSAGIGDAGRGFIKQRIFCERQLLLLKI